jgi:hypothetical protein
MLHSSVIGVSVPFLFLQAGPAQGHAVVKHHVIADNLHLADDCTGMNLNSRRKRASCERQRVIRRYPRSQSQ